MRSVRFVNYVPVEVRDADEVADRHACLSPVLLEARDIITLHRGERNRGIGLEIQGRLVNVTSAIRSELARQELSLGERVRNLVLLMDLEQIRGSATGLERAFEDYLEAMASNDLPNLMLSGGYAHTLRGPWKPGAARQRLTERWLSALPAKLDPELAVSFMRVRFQERQWHVVSRLCKQMKDTQLDSDTLRFEWFALGALSACNLRGNSEEGVQANSCNTAFFRGKDVPLKEVLQETLALGKSLQAEKKLDSRKMALLRQVEAASASDSSKMGKTD